MAKKHFEVSKGLTLKAQTTAPSDPTNGDIYYDSTLSRFRKYENGAWSNFGSAGASITYFTNGDAELDTTGWATYADAAAASPVDGTGGSPTVTWTQSTSSPLRGTGSFLLTKGASNRQGDGASYLIAIDSADQGKMLTGSFDYTVASGTYADGDLTVWIYDVTNSLLIQPSGSSILSIATGLSQRKVFTFQTATNSTSYRVIIHTTSTSASAYTVKFDNFSVGPQAALYGPAMTDWTSVTMTPSAGFGTTSLGSYWVKREGDIAKFKGYFKAGTVAGSSVYLTMPTGYVIDSTKFAATASAQRVGDYSRISTGATINTTGAASFKGTLFYDGSDTAKVYLTYESASNVLTTELGTSWGASSDGCTFEFSVPIAGWSSNVLMSSDSDTRVVAAYVTGCGVSVTSSGVALTPTTIVKDTHGAFSGSTYTVPVPGFYEVASYLAMNSVAYTVGDAASVRLFQNGSQVAFVTSLRVQATNSFAMVLPPGSALVYCNAGDTLQVKGFSSVTATANDQYTSFKRLAGPNTIAASETIGATYNSAVGQSILNNTTTIIQYDTKEFDTHLAITTGASWKFTAPDSGIYELYAQVTLTSTSYTSGGAFNLAIHKNTIETKRSLQVAQATSTRGPMNFVKGQFNLIKGDTLDVRIFQSNGTVTMNGSATDNFVDVKRVR